MRKLLAVAGLLSLVTLVACADGDNVPTDAGTSNADASSNSPDATSDDAGVQFDASASAEDASTNEDDAAASEEDASASAEDASAIEEDASAGGEDASVSEEDASTSAEDASSEADAGDTNDAGEGDSGSPLCTDSPNSCTGGEVCLGEACACIQAIHGQHILRTDGTVLYFSGTQTVVTTSGHEPLSRVVEIYTGGAHGCGLKDDGTVWCWPTNSGGNAAGQLGNGGMTPTLSTPSFFVATPVMIDDETPLDSVDHLSKDSSRGYLASNTCAARHDGTLWCWGSADSSGGGGGTLFNDGASGARANAVEILAAASTPLTAVEAVSMGTRHYCLLRNGGEVWCWGANIGGPLGQGDETGRVYPTKVTLPGPADQVGAGADASCARVGEAVYCWGANNSGQVGIGSPSGAGNHDGCINYCKLTPARVVDTTMAPLGDVVDVNVGYLTICAKKSDHTLWCWGIMNSGLSYSTAVEAIVGGTTLLDDVALYTLWGSGGYSGGLNYVTRDNQFFSATSPITPVCP